MFDLDITWGDNIEPGDVIALGDVHATWKPYSEFLRWVRDSEAIVVILGDLIDRGGEDLKVLEATRRIHEDPETWGVESFYVLKGNHEQMFLDSFSDWGEGPELFFQSARIWFENGGSYDHGEEMARLHYDWVKNLPVLMTIGDTMFVHGGVSPGHDPREFLGKDHYAANSLMWMRKPFLQFGPLFEKWNAPFTRVVHGHTPTPFEGPEQGFLPVLKKDRVNIDTGCYFKGEEETGRLTAYNVTQKTFKQFSND
jgi:serine/threonine protein phosphatase 1